METKAMVILGNGFDVALGIPTRYSEFYNNSKELRRLAKSGNSLCQHILDNIQSDLWSDLERGLYNYSLDLTKKCGVNDETQAMKFRQEFYELRTALFNYLNSVAGNQVLFNQQAPVLGLNVEWNKLQPLYLTFNYSINTANTASMNSRYILNKDDSINENRFVYQHGSIYDTKTCSDNGPDDIVLGIDSDIQKVEDAHSFLYKRKQSLHDLDLAISNIKKARFYIIYGCSVGDSDAMYFKEIFNAEQHEKTFLIYGLGEKSINSIKSNIERICGITINQLQSSNEVEFLNVENVKDARDTTKQIINSYITSIL